MIKLKKDEQFKKLRIALFNEYQQNPDVTPKDLARLATLYMEYDKNKLIQKEAERQIRAMVAYAKTDEELRRYFCNGKGKIIDIENADIEDYKKVEIQFIKKFDGLRKSYNNIVRHRQLKEQIPPLS